MLPDVNDVRTDIRALANIFSQKLKEQIDIRSEEMKADDTSHHLIYNTLGIGQEYGKNIDLYQNIGRFLYKYAGSFLEESVIQIFKRTFQEDIKSKQKIVNNESRTPKTFEIDIVHGKNAYEVKWRDATTDGDHIAKEIHRIKAIKDHGYIPIRLMFFIPNRTQAINIQNRLREVYAVNHGEYYSGKDAWKYVHNKTGIDLHQILCDLSRE